PPLPTGVAGTLLVTCAAVVPYEAHRANVTALASGSELLIEFRNIAARAPNRWRVRRVELLPDHAQSSSGWQDREVYDGRFRDAPMSLLYRQDQQAFVTVCNLARLLRPEDAAAALVGREIRLQGDDDRVQRTLRVQQIKDSDSKSIGQLGIYHPVILLELSPLRFRVLAPLEAASGCLDRAIEAWNTQFARVWDRLPLRAGMVAFPQKLPFQAAIDAVRNVEERLTVAGCETWRITDRQARADLVALTVKRPDGVVELRTVPVDLPDGRTDVFYPYLAVEDDAVRFPRDFQHPDGQVYRHALDLRKGDGIRVYPARVATLFLDSTGRRFDPITPRPLSDWGRMREVWRVVERVAPSLTALRGAWADLLARKESWRDPDGEWLPGGQSAWRELARAIFADRLAVAGHDLDALVEAADDGTLDWSLDWHLSVLKEQIGEVTRG
ncbi:MAG: hypothetical protein M1296_07065, partial [Chloroflexi bacterium]|nr:hypothetical protein [Chloroflexota bacterium]